ncbi:hypothetical protein MSAN_02002800 [Mycena sanguinolenta]|uniref:Uncharacterized protein n=1 Tax=Mycena sanguinolenta TaxID=230812 RepID=A0A8H7CM75_9AGAR|nr:hypothetical protein MSAN_02002800 [Mycena sanguinolenta]
MFCVDTLKSSSTTPSSPSTTTTKTHTRYDPDSSSSPLPPPSSVLVHPIIILDFSFFFPAAFSPSSPVANGARLPLESGAAARAAGKAVAGAAAIREYSSCSSLPRRNP